MKVDMSTKAVTARLLAMDDLWLLSIKLINSGLRRADKPRRRVATRALEIYDSIRQVLYTDWDPLGIVNEALPADEYDAYIAPVYRILVGTRSESDLIKCLRKIENNNIGIDLADPERLLLVARKLLALSVTLDPVPSTGKIAEFEPNGRQDS